MDPQTLGDTITRGEEDLEGRGGMGHSLVYFTFLLLTTVRDATHRPPHTRGHGGRKGDRGRVGYGVDPQTLYIMDTSSLQK